MYKPTKSILLIIFLYVLSCQTSQALIEDEHLAAFKYYSKAVEQQEAKNYEDALKFIDQAISVNNRIASYFALKGDINNQIKNYNNALEAYKKAKELRSFYPEIYVKSAIIYYKQQKFDEAIKDYRKAFALQPENLDLFIRIADCYIQLNEFEVALNQLGDYKTQIEKINKTLSADYFIMSAKIDFERNEFEKVVLAMGEARIKKKLNRNEIVFYLKSLIETNALEDAYKLASYDYKDIISASDFNFVRGLYYYKKNNMNDSKNQLLLCTEGNTVIYEAYKLLAEIYEKEEMNAESVKILEQGISFKNNRLINHGLTFIK